jgi:hypothetical protein
LSIIEATKNSHSKFWNNLFLNSALSPTERKRAQNIISDPFWRPLCELEVNGATTYEGALLLFSSNLIRPTSFRVRRGNSAGSFVECVDFTDAGLQLFNEYAGHEGDDSLREKLINSLMCYAAMDLGNGIVARRSAVEGAIEIDDDEFLSRLRSITAGSYAFSGFEAGLSATLEERFEILQYVTGWDGERTGAEIICLGVEQTTA